MDNSPPLPMSPTKFFGWVMELFNSSSYKKTLAILKPQSKEKHLEIGFGSGEFIQLILNEASGVRVYGIDPTFKMYQMALNRVLDKYKDQVDLKNIPDYPLPWESSTFDGVVAIHSFQFWKEPENTLNEIKRVLTSDGRLVVVFRDHSRNPPSWLPNPISRSGFEVENIISILESLNFTVKEHNSAGSSRIVEAQKNS